MTTDKKSPSLLLSLLPLAVLIALLGINVYFFSDDATYGPNQIALLVTALVAGWIVYRLGYKWAEIQKGIVKSISSAMGAILILLIIGSLIGTWTLAGIVPAMIYYGLQVLNPAIFLFVACAISSVVSLATGSSWSTVGTVGIALLVIGQALGFHEGLVAGAVISGAYFGDKMSPLSDTTNLAPAMAGTDLFTHIRYMAWTTIPSISIALIIFLFIGFFFTPADDANIEEILTVIDGAFNLNPLLFLAPVLVIFLIVKKMPALPALAVGTLTGGLFAIIFQPEVLSIVSGTNISNLEPGQSSFIQYTKAAYQAVIGSMFDGISVFPDPAVANVTVGEDKAIDLNKLLGGKGMAGMLNTVWLIVCAMVFGGVMEVGGLLQRITRSLLGLVESAASLFATTVGACIFFNLTASDQYLAIVVPGRMFRKVYEDKGLAPQNLSRTLEDSGTVTSVLIPWNTCGAYMSGTLGVATFTYLPYCFFNLISPLMTLAFAIFRIKIAQLSKKETAA